MIPPCEILGTGCMGEVCCHCRQHKLYRQYRRRYVPPKHPYQKPNYIILYSKSRGVPRQAEVAQGVPGRLRPRIFLTFRHYKGGRSSAIRTGRLYPRINPWYSLSEAESTSEHMVLSGIPRKKSPVTPPGIDPGTFRPVAQCLNPTMSYNAEKM